MRKIHKVLIPSLLAVSLGLSFVGAFNRLNNEVIKTEASNTYHTTGFYERVTDISKDI